MKYTVKRENDTGTGSESFDFESNQEWDAVMVEATRLAAEQGWDAADITVEESDDQDVPLKKSVYRLGDGTLICADCMMREYPDGKQPETGWTVGVCQFCDESDTLESKIDEKLNTIIEIACKKYRDGTGKSRDEIAAQVEAYFDSDVLPGMADQEIEKHLVRIFESENDSDYNDIEQYDL